VHTDVLAAGHDGADSRPLGIERVPPGRTTATEADVRKSLVVDNPDYCSAHRLDQGFVTRPVSRKLFPPHEFCAPCQEVWIPSRVGRWTSTDSGRDVCTLMVIRGPDGTWT
jgi:hypothetical protein